MSDRADRLTVAMLIQRYHPHVGGAEQQLKALAPRLQVRGVRSLVVTRRLPGTSPRELVDGIPVVRVAARGPKIVAAGGYLGGALAVLARHRADIDILHAHELLSPATVGLVARVLGPMPLVVKVLRGGALSDLRALRRRPLGRLRWRLYRRAVDRFVAISSEIRRELLDAGVPPARIACVPNGVDTERFAPLPPCWRRDLRLRLGLGDHPTAIFVGRLAPEKQVADLIEVWPGVRRAVPGARLLVVGDGPLRAEFDARAGDGVSLLGPRQSVAPYLQASDLFVLPSLAEGLSNAMLEAMACGLCCLVRPHGGALDVIDDGRTGVFLPDPTREALGRSLVALLQRPERCTAVGVAARRAVVSTYSLDATADRLAALYRQLATRRRRP